MKLRLFIVLLILIISNITGVSQSTKIIIKFTFHFGLDQVMVMNGAFLMKLLLIMDLIIELILEMTISQLTILFFRHEYQLNQDIIII
jgi:hypothetical protein